MKIQQNIECVDEMAIRRSMLDQGIKSLSALAALTPYTAAYIHRIVADHEDVSTRQDAVKAIAKALKMSIREVLGNNGLDETSVSIENNT